jgi:flagellar hook-associated protein 3 FlgL
MRVTQKMMNRSMLNDVNRSLSRLSESQLRMASQKKIQRPSDSPGELQTLLAVKDQISAAGQYKTNIEAALLRLGGADSRVTYVSEQLMKAKETLIRSSGVSSPVMRAALAAEFEGIIKSAMEECNARDGNDYIFAGTDSGTVPFTAASGPDSDGVDRIQTVTYTGNSARHEVAVSATESAETGCAGDELVEPAPGAGGIFETLIGLRQAVLSGADTVSLQAALDANMARLDELQVRLGSKIEYLSGVRDRHGVAATEMESRRSAIEDTDFTEEVLEQGRRQAEYQAVLAATSKRSQLSLINYL